MNDEMKSDKLFAALEQERTGQEENLSPQMTIQRLVSDKATAAPTWRDTEYKTLKEARQANPNEYPSFFRRKP